MEFDDIQISIDGIPIVISLSIPVALGYSLDVSNAVALSFRGQVHGPLSYGLSYQKGREHGDDLEIITKSAFTHGGVVTTLPEENANLMLYIMPVVQIHVHHLGVPFVCHQLLPSTCL